VRSGTLVISFAHPDPSSILAVAGFVDVTVDGEVYTVLLLVACLSISAGASVCAWYGAAFSEHRTWAEVDVGHLDEPTLESDVEEFLKPHGIGLEDIIPQCVPRERRVCGTIPSVPCGRPDTVIVD
jgi:hypothetical protein